MNGYQFISLLTILSGAVLLIASIVAMITGQWQASLGLIAGVVFIWAGIEDWKANRD